MQRVDPLNFVSDHCNQPVIIPFDIKNRAITDRIGVPKAFSHIREISPGRFTRNVVPIQQRVLGVRVFFPEFAQFPFTNNSQGASSYPLNSHFGSLLSRGRPIHNQPPDSPCALTLVLT
jgi:hypothetical protein